FNFSKSELRLQNSIDELAREIRLLEGCITELEKAPIPGKVAIVNPVLTVQEAVSTTGADAEGAYKEAINSLMPLNKEEFLRGLTTVNKADREAFIGKYMGTYAELETLQNGEAMDREGLDYRPAADLDTNKLRAEYEKYWKTLNAPNISKEEKRAVKNQPGNVMDIILKGLNDSQIYDLLSGYRTAASAFTVCNSAYNPEEFEKLLADLEIAGKMLEVWDKTKKLHALLDDKKTRKEEIESLADAIYNLYTQIDHYKKSQNPLLQNLHGRLYLGIEDQIVVVDSIVGFTLTADYKRLPEDHPTKKLCAPYEKRAQELSAKRKAYKAASWKEKKDNNLKDLTPEEEQEFEEIAKKLKRAVNNVGRWESFERNVKLAEKDLESLFSEKEGGVELKKSYDIFRKIQREYIQKVVCDGKKDDKLEATMKAAEEQFTRIYKDMALRMLTDQAEEFDEKIEDKTEPDDFLAIMNGVVNDKRTVTMLGIPFRSKLKYVTLITKDDPNDDSELEEAREELTEEEEERLKEMERISDGK
ncbi:MAG: hypothetical protein II754_00255, partial [Lachnospiraceae bacterium]|nr:hypothetical protein [Lachnospiraceae bacterium]